MRDPNLMLELLTEMANAVDGRVSVIPTFGMSEEEQSRRHHLELIADNHHAEYIPDHTWRITNTGYDFIAAANAHIKVREKFISAIKAAHPYLQAANTAMALIPG